MSEVTEENKCDSCDGKGEVLEVCNYKTTCRECGGTGVDELKVASIKIKELEESLKIEETYAKTLEDDKKVFLARNNELLTRIKGLNEQKNELIILLYDCCDPKEIRFMEERLEKINE